MISQERPRTEPTAITTARHRMAQALLLLRAETPSVQQLSAIGFETLNEVAQFVADQLKMPRVELDRMDLSPELARVVSQGLFLKHRIAPVFASAEELTIATAEPTRVELFDWLSRELRRNVITVVATSAEIARAGGRIYDSGVLPTPTEATAAAVTAAELTEATPIIDGLIHRAVEMKASDIHIEAGERETVVRFRIDGMLRQVESRPAALHAAIISRVKIMASLDISERQAPQDGRIKIKRGNREIDLRVSVLPTFYGEKVVCRILDNTKASLPLQELGFDAEQLTSFERMIRNPYGLFLVTGPTGSGKSTTLYGALNAVRSPEINIVSVEDPVEFQLPGINQVQVNPKRGLTFANALRSILRQDPNVILIGEIRDRETAVIAAEAALTGHLVLASLHTNDATSAVTRLTEMGLEPHLLAPALVGVVAQRLMRRVCEECKELYQPTHSELAALGLPEGKTFQFARGRGCASCRGGCSGRVAVREVLAVTDNLRMAIVRGDDAGQLRKTACAEGFKPLRLEALRRLFGHVTPAQEVIRLTRSA